MQIRLGKRQLGDQIRLGKRQAAASIADSMRLGKRQVGDQIRLGKRAGIDYRNELYLEEDKRGVGKNNLTLDLQMENNKCFRCG